MTPYTAAERREFIDFHVAHRLTALLTVMRRQQDPGFFIGKGDLYCGCIEGAYIMLRVFVEFLGVESRRVGGQLQLVQRTRQKAKVQKVARDTDVMLDCFGLPLVPVSDFGSQAELIARVHDGLSKSTAHFTYRTNHEFRPEADFVPAVNLVLRLLQSHFFRPLGETPKLNRDLPNQIGPDGS
jgi:hypothetical protein